MRGEGIGRRKFLDLRQSTLGRRLLVSFLSLQGHGSTVPSDPLPHLVLSYLVFDKDGGSGLVQGLTTRHREGIREPWDAEKPPGQGRWQPGPREGLGLGEGRPIEMQGGGGAGTVLLTKGRGAGHPPPRERGALASGRQWVPKGHVKVPRAQCLRFGAQLRDRCGGWGGRGREGPLSWLSPSPWGHPGCSGSALGEPKFSS